MNKAKQRLRADKRQKPITDSGVGKFAPGKFANRVTRERSELVAYMARFPNPGPAALALNVAVIVAGNAFLFWQVLHGVLSLVGIVLLVLVDTVLLSVLTVAQRAGVPPSHRMQQEYRHLSLGQQSVRWIVCLVAVGGLYLAWAMMLNQMESLSTFLNSWQAWLDAGLHIALGITLLFAVAGMMVDYGNYRRHGPPFVSSIESESSARRMTVLFGVFVVAIPLAGITFIGRWLLVWLVGQRKINNWHIAGGLALVAAFFGSFFALMETVASGPQGWAAVYLLGKVEVEILFALMPFLAARVAKAG